MIVTFTLQGQYSGATYVAGPFNISGTTSGNVTTQLASGITKSQLLAGYTINNVNDLITGGTIASTGTCTNTQQWVAFPSPTPTPTITPNSIFTFTNSGRGTSTANACSDNRTLYSNCEQIQMGCIVYLDQAGNIPLTGFQYVQIGGATWDMNMSTGAITFASAEQC